MFTIGNWIFFGIWAVATLVTTIIIICYFASDGEIAAGLGVGFMNLVISLAILGGIMAYVNWYHTSTASGVRDMKDYYSELENGIDREVRITSEDGREIFYYEGKIDIESNHEDNYIKFESEEGKRYIIYYGIQDTITIIEK